VVAYGGHLKLACLCFRICLTWSISFLSGHRKEVLRRYRRRGRLVQGFAAHGVVQPGDKGGWGGYDEDKSQMGLDDWQMGWMLLPNRGRKMKDDCNSPRGEELPLRSRVLQARKGWTT